MDRMPPSNSSKIQPGAATSGALDAPDPGGEAPVKVVRALLSVSDKAGLVELAKDLDAEGVELVA